MCTNAGLVYAKWLPKAKGDEPRHPNAKLKWLGDCSTCDVAVGPFPAPEAAEEAMKALGHKQPTIVAPARSARSAKIGSPAANPWLSRDDVEHAHRAVSIPLKDRARRRPDRTIDRTRLETVGAKGLPVHASGSPKRNSGVRLSSGARRAPARTPL